MRSMALKLYAFNSGSTMTRQSHPQATHTHSAAAHSFTATIVHCHNKVFCFSFNVNLYTYRLKLCKYKAHEKWLHWGGGNLCRSRASIQQEEEEEENNTQYFICQAV